MPRVNINYWISEEGLRIIATWASSGITDQQLAGNIGISRDTLAKWRKRCPQLETVLQRSKSAADAVVVNALYRAACGGKHTEITREAAYNAAGQPILGEDGEPILRVSKTVEKTVAPNVTACIFWLRNRDKESWRDQRAGIGDDDGEIEDLTPIAEMLKSGGVDSG